MPENENIHLKRAEAFIEVERWREAIHELHLFLTVEPQNYDAMCQLARCHWQLHEHEQAMKHADRAIVINPTKEWAYRLKSSTFFRQKKMKKSLEFAEKAVQADPQEPLALKSLVSVQVEMQKLKEAEKTAENLRSIAPESFEAHFSLGLVAIHKNNMETATEHFERALKLEPNSSNTYSNYGYALMKQAEYKSVKTRRKFLFQALDAFERALSLNPNDTYPREMLLQTSNSICFTDKLVLFPVIGLAIFFFILIGNLKYVNLLPDFLNFTRKSNYLFFLNTFAVAESLIFLLIWMIKKAQLKFPDKIRQILEVENRKKLKPGYLFLYLLLVLAPWIALTVWLSVNGFSALLQLSIFDWFCILMVLVCLIYMARFSFNNIRR